MKNKTKKIKVSINGKLHKFQKDVTISEVLYIMNFSNTKGIAVAVNEQIISGNKWKEFIVSSDDKIVIIQATQGG